MKRSILVAMLLSFVASFFAPEASAQNAQRTYPPPSQCPVLASLASSKVPSSDNSGDHIVIFFWN